MGRAPAAPSPSSMRFLGPFLYPFLEFQASLARYKIAPASGGTGPADTVTQVVGTPWPAAMVLVLLAISQDSSRTSSHHSAMSSAQCRKAAAEEEDQHVEEATAARYVVRREQE